MSVALPEEFSPFLNEPALATHSFLFLPVARAYLGNTLTRALNSLTPSLLQVEVGLLGLHCTNASERGPLTSNASFYFI